MKEPSVYKDWIKFRAINLEQIERYNSSGTYVIQRKYNGIPTTVELDGLTIFVEQYVPDEETPQAVARIKTAAKPLWGTDINKPVIYYAAYDYYDPSLEEQQPFEHRIRKLMKLLSDRPDYNRWHYAATWFGNKAQIYRCYKMVQDNDWEGLVLRLAAHPHRAYKLKRPVYYNATVVGYTVDVGGRIKALQMALPLNKDDWLTVGWVGGMTSTMRMELTTKFTACYANIRTAHDGGLTIPVAPGVCLRIQAMDLHDDDVEGAVNKYNPSTSVNWLVGRWTRVGSAPSFKPGNARVEGFTSIDNNTSVLDEGLQRRANFNPTVKPTEQDRIVISERMYQKGNKLRGYAIIERGDECVVTTADFSPDRASILNRKAARFENIKAARAYIGEWHDKNIVGGWHDYK